MKLFAAQLNFTIADVRGNGEKIKGALDAARQGGADVVLFSELALCGYPPEDLLFDERLIRLCVEELNALLPWTKGLFAVIGLPRLGRGEKRLFNSAAVCIDGKLAGFYDKQLLPTYNVFDERRYFSPALEGRAVWPHLGKNIGITICEDVWEQAHVLGQTHYGIDPLDRYQPGECDVLLNLSASPFYEGKVEERFRVFKQAACRLKCPILMCNQVGANDQLIFDGGSFWMNEAGEVVSLAGSFSEAVLQVDLTERRFQGSGMGASDLSEALILGIRDYFHKQGFTKGILGLSGGIDSAVVATLAVQALGASHVKALGLPTRYTSAESERDAKAVAALLGIDYQVIEIDSLFEQYLLKLASAFGTCPSSLTEENLQARIRGMILMAYSNQTGALLLNTSNKSEAAMGYTTLYGDLCGGLGPLLDLTKTKVYELAQLLNRKKKRIPDEILAKPPSAELRAGQKDSDTLPPYEVLDPILEEIFSETLDSEEIVKRYGALGSDLLQKVQKAEYKRRQAPLGLCVTKKAFTKGRFVPVAIKPFF